jgi:hypothetical protein
MWKGGSQSVAKFDRMAGQWLGKFTGTNAGDLILDLDDYGDYVAGHALAFDADAQPQSF